MSIKQLTSGHRLQQINKTIKKKGNKRPPETFYYLLIKCCVILFLDFYLFLFLYFLLVSLDSFIIVINTLLKWHWILSIYTFFFGFTHWKLYSSGIFPISQFNGNNFFYWLEVSRYSYTHPENMFVGILWFSQQKRKINCLIYFFFLLLANPIK